MPSDELTGLIRGGPLALRRGLGVGAQLEKNHCAAVSRRANSRYSHKPGSGGWLRMLRIQEMPPRKRR
jgi:hypothetical protein